MVSFSCESCGDVLTKKKLDGHRNQCRGASFSCLDCMVHFQGTDYRSHTSCISEAQKYQGALYKGKPKKKSVNIVDPNVSKQPYVEEVPDFDTSTAVAIVNAPPHAPSPPPSAPPHPVNVFDFLVDEDNPNASRVSLGGSKEQMCMVKHAPPIFRSNSESPSQEEPTYYDEDQNCEENGYTYGETPVAAANFHYETPDPKALTKYDKSKSSKSTDKKRKRQVEELDLSRASRSSAELDEEMLDADSGAPVLHSGLTGGLNRLLSTSAFPPSPDYSNGSGADPSPLSPAKRKRASNIRIEKRGRYAGQLVKVRKPARRSSDESRPRKQHRKHKGEDGEGKTLKAIEYHHRGASPNGHAGNQLVVYQSRAEHFLSFVTKGPSSTAGYSINKALKRYHRERGEGGDKSKHEEEKELWKSLRLKRNDRGEVVLFVSDER